MTDELNQTEQEQDLDAIELVDLDAADAEIGEPRVYELGYLLLPNIAEDATAEEADSLRSILTSNGGLPISEGAAKSIELAYEMEKIIENKRKTFNRAYFGWIKFDASPEAIAAIEAALKAHPNVLRFMLTKTVRENTLAPAKPVTPRSARPRSEAKPSNETSEKPAAPAEPINEKELDKQIDELVAE